VAKRIPRGLPAITPEGALITVLNSSFQEILLKVNLTAEQASAYGTTRWNTASPAQTLLQDYAARTQAYTTPALALPTNGARSTPEQTNPAHQPQPTSPAPAQHTNPAHQTNPAPAQPAPKLGTKTGTTSNIKPIPKPIPSIKLYDHALSCKNVGGLLENAIGTTGPLS
jgi:hypothetical protein